MYIVRKTLPNGQLGFKTYEGWAWFTKGQPLDLKDAQRFTISEAKQENLKKHEEFVWFGCYKEID